jgi:hypothetical protein
MSEEKKMS